MIHKWNRESGTYQHLNSECLKWGEPRIIPRVLFYNPAWLVMPIAEKRGPRKSKT